jgi:hypothetical protein
MGTNGALLPHQIHSNYLQRVKVWGCLTYILNPKVQDRKKIPKWESRAHLGILRFSDNHSSLVGLVRSVRTEYVSPQFHVVYYERFTTINNTQDSNQSWIEIFVKDREYNGADDEEEES